MKTSRSLLKFEILAHIIFWVIYFVYPIIKFSSHRNYQFDWKNSTINLLITVITIYSVYSLIMYLKVNWKVLLFGFLFFSFGVYVSCVISTSQCDCDLRICIINKAVETLFILILFAGILIFRRNILSQKALQKSEEERIRAELEGLKTQVNPHFLFNTLNMLYSNAIDKDQGLADNILKLSDNLHYILHEGPRDKVSLEIEINFIEDYISLQKERLGNKIVVNFSVETDNPNTPIPPLLLIPFVENAFKYTSTMKGKDLPIDIQLKVKDNALDFKVINAFTPNGASRQAPTLKESGIGIKNTRKRLELLYQNDFYLNTHQGKEIFEINLNIAHL